MTAIAQMQVRYDALEDRLLLRVRSAGGDELRFWLTRRYLALAWPALRQRLETGLPAAAAGEARRALASFEHENAVQAADFSTPYQEEARALPLGDTPLLLARFALREGADGGAVLSMHPRRGQGANLALPRPMLHSFCKLLAEAVTHADWSMSLALPSAGTTTGVAH